MTITTETRTPRRTSRHLAFRIVCALIAIVLVGGFQAWRGLIAPWLVLPDATDHEWVRTPELHRLADAAAGAYFLAVGTALVLLLIRPRGRSGLSVWAIVNLAAMALFSSVSIILQSGDVPAALITAAVSLVIFAGPLIALMPARRDLFRSGRPAADHPTGITRRLLQGATVIGLAIVVGAWAWRLSGGVIENVREDDVVGFTLIGVLIASGAALTLRGREGWRPLAWIVAGVGAYALVAGVSILVS